MSSSWLLNRVTVVTTDVSEDPSATIIRLTIGELETMLAVMNPLLFTANVDPM
jgi:hypothetical protein